MTLLWCSVLLSLKKETQNNTASPWHKFSNLLKISKLHLNKWWCESIHLNNLLSFHKISNIPIRISSSSPHASAFKRFNLSSTKMREQIGWHSINLKQNVYWHFDIPIGRIRQMDASTRSRAWTRSLNFINTGCQKSTHILCYCTQQSVIKCFHSIL